ncbi:MAG TPA: bifunctional biotin--[acetyl-CoA-carboxylase] ligase/biotin operon repressor BirA [Xylella fastidiosa subsp. multiplex]
MDERVLLTCLGCSYVSGNVLASMTGMTEATIAACIQALRAVGIPIKSRAEQGYALAAPLSLLTAERIRAELSHSIAAELRVLDVAWTLESTNTSLLARPALADGVEVLLAESQTGGRGQRGRSWISPLAANIYLSLSRVFSRGAAQVMGLSVAVGVAIAEALIAAGFSHVRLKWPNDLVDNGRKLGGVLVERQGVARAVIGLGLNVRMPTNFAEQIDQPWVDLETLAGSTVERNALVALLLSALLPALHLFQLEGLAPFLPRYTKLDCLVGCAVWIEEANLKYVGIARGLAADGALLVEINGVLRPFHTGQVSVRPI